MENNIYVPVRGEQGGISTTQIGGDVDVKSLADLDYFKKLRNTEKIELIPPTLDAYEHILNTVDLDYIGTRLHGGIYAMRHKKRAIIIAIDERAREINANNNLNCLNIDETDKLEAMINSEFETNVIMPFDEIARWKLQFKEF